MPKPDSQETENLKLEDLLALKRHERPDDAFWDRFERELHAKPWQKMVTRKSWTSALWARLGDIAHPAIPLGSVAAIALAGYWSVTALTTTAEHQPSDPKPAQLARQDSAPAPDEPTAGDAAPALAPAEPQFVVGSFSSTEPTESTDPTFTTVAATHYMPASQRDGVHFAYNTIDSAAHASLAMATGPVRSIY